MDIFGIIFEFLDGRTKFLSVRHNICPIGKFVRMSLLLKPNKYPFVLLLNRPNGQMSLVGNDVRPMSVRLPPLVSPIDRKRIIQEFGVENPSLR